MKDRGFIERLIDRAKAAGLLGAGADAGPADPGAAPQGPEERPERPAQADLANLINMATKPRWCLGMLGTQRRQFGNIVGHVRAWTTWDRCPNGPPSSSTRR
jgi:L-lactate dehydrogenase (cytochrome)